MFQINTSKRVLCGLASIVALATAGCSHSDDEQQSQQQAPAKSAQVYQVSSQNIELDKSFPSMIRSDNAASVTARVQGFLKSQVYKPGQIVKKGTPLFTIERETYAAAVDQARADLASAKANLVNAQRNYQRYAALYQKGVISALSMDSYKNSLETSTAAVKQAQAALQSAQINLGYTTVRAPADGQVGLNKVNVGNLVDSGTELATVTPINPLEVRFQMPQGDAMQVRQQEATSNSPRVGAELELSDGQSDAKLTGHLDFIGNSVNTGTSTVEARAVFDNPNGIFLPGQFVRVHLTNLMRFNVFAVPEIAITQGLMGPQVYVLNGNNEIVSRNVQPGDQAGSWQIVTDGLKRGDRIIAGDTGGLNVGDKIDPQPFNGNAGAVSADQQGEAAAQPAADTSDASSDQ